MFKRHPPLCCFGFFIFFLIFFGKTAEAANLHLFLMGDLDTKDLHEAILVDFKNVEQEAEKICKYTGLNLQKTTVPKEQIRTSEIINSLRDFNPSIEDIVLFYYTGHGYRTSSKQDPWPNLYFSYENKGIDLFALKQIFSKKKAHLSIILIDCCNNIISDFSAPPLTKFASLFSTSLTRKNYTALFIETNGFIMATSSKTGQTSLCSSNGSFYTLSLLKALNADAKESKNPSWENIFKSAMKRTQTMAAKFGHNQQPYYELTIEKK